MLTLVKYFFFLFDESPYEVLENIHKYTVLWVVYVQVLKVEMN